MGPHLLANGIAKSCDASRSHARSHCFSVQRSGDAPPLPLSSISTSKPNNPIRLQEDAPRSTMLTSLRRPNDETASRETAAQSREQSSRIKGHRRAAGREDSTRSRGPSGHTAEKQQQPRGGRIAVSGDERQGQCGSQQADRGEEAAEICDTSPPVSPPNHPENKTMDAFLHHLW
ncbi:hypothetical protein Q5P01_022211 [Channa striata]|uniref:Uncharacterized protein n=1 Tax=Channa striata TaxID=64152 RepID=A0AA88LQY8_CHASR|nr:hypothetical protein Q5P01_022211 [Channa striata]